MQIKKLLQRIACNWWELAVIKDISLHKRFVSILNLWSSYISNKFRVFTLAHNLHKSVLTKEGSAYVISSVIGRDSAMFTWTYLFKSDSASRIHEKFVGLKFFSVANDSTTSLSQCWWTWTYEIRYNFSGGFKHLISRSNRLWKNVPMLITRKPAKFCIAAQIARFMGPTWPPIPPLPPIHPHLSG